jgi:hypothetical protein
LESVEVVFDQLAQALRQIDIRPAFCGGVEQGAQKQRVYPQSGGAAPPWRRAAVDRFAA